MAEESYAELVNEQLAILAQDLDSSELVLAAEAPRDSNHYDPKRRSLTRMELIKIILSLQEIQNIQMDRLQELVDQTDHAKENQTPLRRQRGAAAFATSSKTMEFTQPAATTQDRPMPSKRHWTVGRPLETLVESEESPDGKQPKSTPRNSGGNNTPSTMATSTPWSHETAYDGQSTSNGRDLFEKNSHGLDGSSEYVSTNPDEIAVDSLQHESVESKANETADAPLTDDSTIRSNNSHQDFEHDEEQQDNDDDNETTLGLDESTYYCPPTIVASERKKQQRQQQHHNIQHLYDTPSRIPLPSTPMDRRRRVSHISINMDASPAPTVLTMDLSAFDNDSNQHHGWGNDDDNQSMTSQETPVLERYRVDRSPAGLAVVPNQRGARRHTISARKTVTFPTPPKPFPSSACRQAFRKTPYRPTRLLPATPTIDENKPYDRASLQGQDLLDQYDLDEESLLLSPASSPQAKNAAANENAPTVMESGMVHDSHAMAALADEAPLALIESENVSPSKNERDKDNRYSLPSCVSYARARMEMDKTGQIEPTPPTSRRHSAMAELASLQQSSPMLVSPLRSKDRRFSTLSQSYNNSRRIQPITQDEYSIAPRIIQMQVTMADVEAATKLLNEALDLGLITRQFSDTRAKLLLKPLGYSQRKCKTVMMSLCHWQRLIIRRLSQVGGTSQDEPLGLYFEVV